MQKYFINNYINQIYNPKGYKKYITRKGICKGYFFEVNSSDYVDSDVNAEFNKTYSAFFPGVSKKNLKWRLLKTDLVEMSKIKNQSTFKTDGIVTEKNSQVEFNILNTKKNPVLFKYMFSEYFSFYQKYFLSPLKPDFYSNK